MRKAVVRAAVAAMVLCGLLGLGRDAALPSFDGNAGWINSAPLTAADLKGKVVLVDFWEYTCINCLRTLPYLKAWYRRYHDDGLVIVGVHTPEFLFSKERKNVAAATQRLGVTWPVVLDNDYAIWHRFDNDAWPHEYLFDQSGHLVEGVSGEGFYQRTETTIQKLLHDQHPGLKLPPVMALLPQDNYTKPGAVCYPHTDEILIGRSRIADEPMIAASGGDQNYIDPGKHTDGAVYLNGYWHRDGGGVVSGGSEGYAALAYHAIQVVAVMKSSGGPIRVNVDQDGKPVARADAGPDIAYDAKGQSYVLVSQPRAYELLDNAVFGSHELRLSPSAYGLALYSFAFESCEVPGAAPHAP